MAGRKETAQLAVGPSNGGLEETAPHPDKIVGHPIEEGPARIEEPLFCGTEPGQVVGGLGAEGQGEALGPGLRVRVRRFQPSVWVT